MRDKKADGSKGIWRGSNGSTVRAGTNGVFEKCLGYERVGLGNGNKDKESETIRRDGLQCRISQQTNDYIPILLYSSFLTNNKILSQNSRFKKPPLN